MPASSLEQPIAYPDDVLPRWQFQFCPMCTAGLEARADNDGAARNTCPACGWEHCYSNAVAVNVVVRVGGDKLVALLPPDAQPEAPAALPGGHVEYGESPEEAAVREAKEETGFDVEVTHFLGWYFDKPIGYPGPIVSFMFEAAVTGGAPKGSAEGHVQLFSIDEFPEISPGRQGSRWALEAFLNRLNG